ncbi:MAG: adenylate/guanylate cyclase domain-containing protein, partial [Actinomycetota bacterium]|nr:adenylate/guanylate cyclase domain-containing protein [Actinomycetota bacterium]
LAHLAGVAAVALLLGEVTGGGANETGRSLVLATATGYLLVAMPVTAVVSWRRQQATHTWLDAGRVPNGAEAAHALRLPLESGLAVFAVWTIGAVLIGGVAAVVFPAPWTGLQIGVAVVLGGLVTGGVVYLINARLCRAVTVRALAVHTPTGTGMPGVRSRLVLGWVLTSGIPFLGVILLVLEPGTSDAPGAWALVLMAVLGIVVGALTAELNARAVARPLRDLRAVVRSMAVGNYAASVVVDDAGELGQLQRGVNSMAAGLAERERLRDLFGRHVGTAVAQRALANGSSLDGDEVVVAALYVDITRSTALLPRYGPRGMVDLLNRFFRVVVDAVVEERGLVNKFAGDAALCVFGAPTAHEDPAGAALRAARQICDAVRAAGEVDIGVGVSWGSVWAGHVGTSSRLEFTVIGDAVNEAARLAERAKDLPGRAVASETAVHAAVDEGGHWVEDAVVQLRGREALTTTWVRRLP